MEEEGSCLGRQEWSRLADGAWRAAAWGAEAGTGLLGYRTCPLLPCYYKIQAQPFLIWLQDAEEESAGSGSEASSDGDEEEA